ncbi:hypothetical protein O9992_24615 [Vibrio lentus]|nr:hypothetical protein [Vibrio lentus]
MYIGVEVSFWYFYYCRILPTSNGDLGLVFTSDHRSLLGINVCWKSVIRQV